MTEELPRGAFDDGFHLVEEIEAGLGDVSDDDAAIVVVAALADELEALEAIEQAGDVGFRGDHAVADGGAWQAVRLGSAQDAKDVVLGGGEAPSAGAAMEFAMQQVGGAHDVEQGFFFGTGEWKMLRDFGFQVGHGVSESASQRVGESA